MTEPSSPPSPAPLDHLAGRLVSDRYRLDRLIASGGMAQVWEAADEVLARRVAVKILHPHLAADEKFVARFRQEAIAAARLAHAGIVSIYDTCSDNGVECIVMELVRGTTLRKLLDERHFLEPGQAVAVVAEVADALEVAHKAGIVHRDIKPANILLSDDARVLVADFGIAKAGDDLTNTGTTLGTAKYLAPEQVEGTTVDARTDVYALGVVLYECLCGRAPFAADTEAATALARLHQDPMRPRNVKAGIPKPIEDVVLRAMARQPFDRYESAGAFRAALLAASRGEILPETVRPPAPLPGDIGHDATMAVAVDNTPAGFIPPKPPPPVPAPAPSGPGGRPPGPPRRSRWIVPTLLAILILSSLVMVAILVRSGEGGGTTVASGGSTDQTDTDTGFTIRSAAAFDPEGDDSENSGDARLAVDGKADTEWSTEGYNTRQFANIKDGVGLVINLNRAADLESISVTSGSNDWSAEVYVVEDEVPSDKAGWGEPADQKEHIETGTKTFDLKGRRGTAILIWITDLGDEPPNTHTTISEVKVAGKV